MNLPPIIAGYLSSLNGAYPIVAAGVTMFVGWLVFISLKMD